MPQYLTYSNMCSSLEFFIFQPHNVLMAYGAGGVTCKLSDFGTCIRAPASQLLSEQLGTSGYTAPEVFDPQAYSLPADVFSLGVTMWELFYSHISENPFSGMDPDDFVTMVGPFKKLYWCC